MTDLVILGAGGFAREAAWIVRDMNRAYGQEIFRLRGCIAPKNEEPEKLEAADLEYLGNDEWGLENLDSEVAYVIGVGDPPLRKSLDLLWSQAGFAPATLVHPSVNMSGYVSVGEGAMICAGAVLTSQVTVGRQVVVNLNATVGHDVVLEDYANISPGVNLSGNVEIGEGSFLGAGANVLPGIKIGQWTVVGAGAVVTQNLPDRITAKGVPAKF